MCHYSLAGNGAKHVVQKQGSDTLCLRCCIDIPCRSLLCRGGQGLTYGVGRCGYSILPPLHTVGSGLPGCVRGSSTPFPNCCASADWDPVCPTCIWIAAMPQCPGIWCPGYPDCPLPGWPFVLRAKRCILYPRTGRRQATTLAAGGGEDVYGTKCSCFCEIRCKDTNKFLYMQTNGVNIYSPLIAV